MGRLSGTCCGMATLQHTHTHTPFMHAHLAPIFHNFRTFIKCLLLSLKILCKHFIHLNRENKQTNGQKGMKRKRRGELERKKYIYSNNSFHCHSIIWGHIITYRIMEINQLWEIPYWTDKEWKVKWWCCPEGRNENTIDKQ